MSKLAGGYKRDLLYDPQVRPFVENVLCISGKRQIDKAVLLIKRSEVWMRDFGDNSTLNSSGHWIPPYNTNKERENLRIRIVQELFDNERLLNDDKISLGRGGAKPIGGIALKDQKVYIVIGLPASGKSSVASTIADFTSSYLIDSDLAKRKLSEYKNDGGASLVHEESSYLADMLLTECTKGKFNMVVPRIGNDFASIREYCGAFVEKGYSVYLVLVELDRQYATIRAYNRYIETKRYIPLSLIYDSYINDSTLTYYRLKQRSPNLLSGFIHLNNEVAKGKPPRIVECCNMEDIGNLF